MNENAVTTPINQDVCVYCGKPAQFMCALCGPVTKYCSQECQVAHWPDHQRRCGGDASTITSNRYSANSGFSSKRSSRASAAHAIYSSDVHRSSQISRTRPDGIAEEPVEDESHEMTEEERAEELKFYVEQIYKIVKPVLACILLSIFWVKVANSGQSDYRPSGSAGQVYTQLPGQSAGQVFLGSLQNALIIIGQIIVMTIIIACLFKYGKIKVCLLFHPYSAIDTVRIDSHRIFHACCSVIAGFHGILVRTQSVASVWHSHGLYYVYFWIIQFCSGWINHGLLERSAVVYATSLFNAHVLFDGVFLDRFGGMDHLDLTCTSCDLGYPILCHSLIKTIL